MTEKSLIEKNKLIQQIFKMPHGSLKEYLGCLPIAEENKDLFAHFIAWNSLKSKVDDNKIAFPVIALRTLEKTDTEYAENAIAALMKLNPRHLIKAYLFSKDLSFEYKVITGGWRKVLQQSIQKYLEVREQNTKWWDSAVIRNRKAMLALYAISHKTPSERAQKVLFDKNYPENSVFDVIKNLGKMSAIEAGAKILKHNLPMSVIMGSGVKIRDNETLLVAMLEKMTGNEILNSTNMLKQLGAFNFKSVNEAYNSAICRAKDDKRVNVFKASKAIEKVDKKEGEKLLTIQKSKEKELTSISGNVAILADASSSMTQSLILAKSIAGIISSRVSGKQFLIFFNTFPRTFDITGKSYDKIVKLTSAVKSEGSTSIGCGLKYLEEKKEIVDVIIIVSDGGDNTAPFFNIAYNEYCNRLQVNPVVYFFRVSGDPDTLSSSCKRSNISLETFEISNNFDYYTLPSLLDTIKLSRFDLINEILDTPLLSLNNIFSSEREE